MIWDDPAAASLSLSLFFSFSLRRSACTSVAKLTGFREKNNCQLLRDVQFPGTYILLMS